MAIQRSETDLRVWLRDAVADLLEIDPREIDVDRPLTELGISSRDAVGLVGELEDYLDRDLDATLIWQTPTISALAAALASDGSAQAGPHADNASAAASVAQLENNPVDDASTGREPIAIIGVGCRLPGDSTSPSAFWDLLVNARDAVSDVPEGRWDEFSGQPGTAAHKAVERTNRSGGFLGGIDVIAGFDADHFGISPREAELMDPQQRMLLEVVVEAMDHAGLRPEDLRGSDTGVWVGMSTNEYSHLAASDLGRIDAYLSTGSAFSIAANRISYLFDLRGPSMTLDTACSSSLVAIHQACRSIASGETSTAFVAGVNLTLGPAITMTFEQAAALAPSGGPKPFSDDADGIARAEGTGVVVLKRLSQAQADGDRILAVVRGSGVNQDGRSNGLTAPNPVAQEALLRDVYAKAGIDPASVDYIEAHGTGTLLGDPIEAAALGAVLGAGRPADKPLLLGSVKSNLGHLESAAGMAGVIKVVLGMQHDLIPASLKYTAPNRHIRFDDWHLAVAAQAQAWPRHSGRALAGVSGFGFGGTNAHVVIEEWPAATSSAPSTEDSEDDEKLAVAIPLSAANADRVKDRAGALATWLAGDGAQVPLREVAHTLTRRRGRGQVANVVSARGRAGLIEALTAVADGAEPSGMPKGTTAIRKVQRITALRPDTTRAVWVFSGMGSAWLGMAKQLLLDEAAFAASIDEIDPLMAAQAGFSLRGAIEGSTQITSLAQIQIATFGIQVALAQLWRSYGVEPAAVVGHSMGEVAAAVVAGGLSLADGVRVIEVRSRLLEEGEAEESGGMAVVELDAAELDRVHDRFPDVSICVYSSPSQLTVGSPDAEQLDGLVKYVETLGRTAWPLPIKGAAHSASMDRGLPALREQIAGITGLTPTVPYYSTAMEDPRAGLDPAGIDFGVEYWVRNVRQPVRFAQAIGAAAQDGHAAYLEISPHPITGTTVKQSAAGTLGSDLVVLGTLRRNSDDGVVFRANATALSLAGLEIDLDRLVPVTELAHVPDRVWRHERFWVQGSEPEVPAAVIDGHPLLGLHVELPEGGRHLWRADIGTARLSWLNDHQVFGVPVLPVAAYAEMAIAAAREVLAPGQPENAVQLTGLQLAALMSLGEHTDVTTSLTVVRPGSATVEIYARPPGSASTTPMVKHASATLQRTSSAVTAEDSAEGEPGVLIDLTAAEEGQPVDLYAVMRAAGHVYGPSFLGVSDAKLTSAGVAIARADLPEPVADNSHFTVHPVMLDICMQSLVVSGLALLEDPEQEIAEASSQTILPVSVGRVRVHAAVGRSGLVTAQLRRDGEDELVGSVRVVDDNGQLLLEVEDARLRRIDSGDVAVPLPDLLLSTGWEPVALPEGSGDGGTAGWALVDATTDPAIASLLNSDPEILAGGRAAAGSAGALAGGLESVLVKAGHRVRRVTPAGSATDTAAEDGDLLQDGEAGLVLVVPALSDDTDAVGGELGMKLASDLAGLATGLAERLAPSGRLFVLSAGAVSVLDQEAGNPAVAQLRGLVRTQAMQAGRARVALIDASLDAESLKAVVRDLIARADGSGDALDDEVALRAGGTRLARRLHRVAPGQLGEPFVLRAGGYVVLDGLGFPGIQIAGELSRRLSGVGESRIVLAGPATAEPEEAAAISELIAGGAPIEVAIADLDDGDAVKRLVSSATAGDQPLRGLVQAPGGALDLNQRDDARTAARAAWLLHEVSIGHPLDLWLLRSSSAALLGGNDESARVEGELGAWLDALVQWRRAQGLPATAVQWGDVSQLAQGQVALAFGLLSPERDVLGVDRLTLEQRDAAAGLPYFTAVAGASGVDELEDDGSWPGPAGLRSMSPGAARQALADRLRLRFATFMGQRPEDVDMDLPLSSLGVDSLIAMRAKNAVEQDIDIAMPVRLLLQGASLADLEAYLAGELGIDAGAVPVAGAGGAVSDVEARDATERWLVSLWGQLTGIPPATSVTTPVSQFGDAEVARQVTVQILERLASQPGARDRRDDWPAEEVLLGAGTIEEQADLVRDLIEDVGGSPMRVLSYGNPEERPLFLFHPAGGTTSVYYPMVSQLDDSLPVYGMERLPGLTPFEDKVAQYIELIREVQPHGPYRMGGWSFGGALAYGTALTLRQQGEEVEGLFMIDTILPRPSDDAQSEHDMLAGRFERFLQYIQATYNLELDIDVHALVELPESEQIDTLIRQVEEAGANLSPALMEHQRTSYEDARMAEKYSPVPYGDGRVVLYRSTEGGLTTSIDPRYLRTDDSLGWDTYCNDLEVVKVPGSHTSMIDRPAVDVMAQHLAQTLTRLPQVVRNG